MRAEVKQKCDESKRGFEFIWSYLNELFVLFKESWGRRKEVNLNLLPINVPVNLDIGSCFSFFCFLLCSSFFCFPFLLCFLSFLSFLCSFRLLSFFLSFPPIVCFFLTDSFSSSLESNLRFSGSTQVIFRKILGIIQNHANISTIQEVGNFPWKLFGCWFFVLAGVKEFVLSGTLVF